MLFADRRDRSRGANQTSKKKMEKWRKW